MFASSPFSRRAFIRVCSGEISRFVRQAPKVISLVKVISRPWYCKKTGYRESAFWSGGSRSPWGERRVILGCNARYASAKLAS